MREEEWRDIKGWEGYYQVSNLGNVKSLERTVRCGRGRRFYRTVPEKIRKPINKSDGYLQVILSKGGKKKTCTVHRLVAEAFLENPENLPEVNHIDENKKNNHMENLEWCSSLYNLTYNDRAKKIGEKNSKPVFSVDKESGLIMWWQSASEAGEVLGINKSHIAACCKGKRKSAGGFYWMYADQEGED